MKKILVFPLIFLLHSCFEAREKVTFLGGADGPGQARSFASSQEDCGTDLIVNGVCQNRELPTVPPIRRDLLKAGHKEEDRHTSGANDYYREDLRSNQQYKVLPYWRPSLDGRLYLAASNNWTNLPRQSTISGNKGLVLLYMDPERFDYDLKTANRTNPLVSGYVVHPLVFLNFHPAHSQLTEQNWGGTYHVDICNDSGYERSEVPRICEAYTNASKTTKTQGDCC